MFLYITIEIAFDYSNQVFVIDNFFDVNFFTTYQPSHFLRQFRIFQLLYYPLFNYLLKSPMMTIITLHTL